MAPRPAQAQARGAQNEASPRAGAGGLSYRQRAAARSLRTKRPPVVAPGMRTRLEVLRLEVDAVRDERDAARLLLVIAEGIHEGYFIGVTYHLRNPVVAVELLLDGPPWQARFATRLR